MCTQFFNLTQFWERRKPDKANKFQTYLRKAALFVFLIVFAVESANVSEPLSLVVFVFVFVSLSLQPFHLYLELSQFTQVAHAKFPLRLSTVGGGVDEGGRGRGIYLLIDVVGVGREQIEGSAGV